MKYFAHWYEDCFNSTEFKASKPNVDKVVIENEKHLERIEKISIPIYNKFVEEQKKYSCK